MADLVSDSPAARQLISYIDAAKAADGLTSPPEPDPGKDPGRSMK
jgi:hypothetical protein